jgi:CRISPR/Cas system-associated exonuclease Cas4 (RecB family)
MIDKRNKHIGYNDELHKYYDLKTGEVYTSVTTVIKKLVPPFDEDYWSLYKALQQYFVDFKLLKTKMTIPEMAKLADVEKLEALRRVILFKWEQKRKSAAAKGTAYHKNQEDKWRSKAVHEIIGGEYNRATTNILDEHENGVFPELLVFNDEYKIAGQIDLAIKKGKKIKLLDYKTNENLDFANRFQTMLPPLSHLDDCNFNHYILQLNLYAFILEEDGYEVEEMAIYHSTFNKVYKVPKRESDIKKLLRWFASS